MECIAPLHSPAKVLKATSPAGYSLEMKLEARVACQVTMAVLFMSLLITAVAFAGGYQGFLVTFPPQRGKGKVFLLNAVALSMTVQAFQPCPQPCFQCLFDWISYRGKCYYFLEAEGNWTSIWDNCSALGASLALLDIVEDLVRRCEDVLSVGGKKKPARDVPKPCDL
uniref:Uncharacterized protein n=1 Tax=Otus sunia TaxID=257818 RepID=A0A8C8AXL9_9STRI